MGIRFAILKENSPSCGVHHVHDGYFRNRLVEGMGVTAEVLRHHGVTVMNEEEGLKFLEDYKREMQIKDERTRVAIARESKPESEPEPKPRREERGPKKHFDRGPAVRGYKGKPTGKPYNSKGAGKRPFKKKPTHD